jgi:hypothetical protein
MHGWYSNLRGATIGNLSHHGGETKCNRSEFSVGPWSVQPQPHLTMAQKKRPQIRGKSWGLHTGTAPGNAGPTRPHKGANRSSFRTHSVDMISTDAAECRSSEAVSPPSGVAMARTGFFRPVPISASPPVWIETSDYRPAMTLVTPSAGRHCDGPRLGTRRARSPGRGSVI